MMFTRIRKIQSDLVVRHGRSRGRLLLIMGARQVGKSTLASRAFPDHATVNFDSPYERSVYSGLSPNDWIGQYPEAILDEVQKLPEVLGTIKACYDRDSAVRYVILGSSQIMLMKKVRESLAGRVAIQELFPFTLPELVLVSPEAVPAQSAFLQLMRAERPVEAIEALVPPTYALQPAYSRASERWQYFLRWGGMPALLDETWTDDDRFEWLRDYQVTYLERDLADLAQLDRLEPFTRAQKALALRTAQPINFSELARLSDVTSPTARKFTRYLEISYQVLNLGAWFRNPEKRLTKRAKLHFLDPGVRRAVLGRRGEPDGAELESAVVAEIYKQLKTERLPVDLHHIRTSDGAEIDLLLEREDGYIGIEIKRSARVGSSDARHLRGLADVLDKPLLLGLVLSNDTQTRRLPGEDLPLWNVGIPWFLS